MMRKKYTICILLVVAIATVALICVLAFTNSKKAYTQFTGEGEIPSLLKIKFTVISSDMPPNETKQTESGSETTENKSGNDSSPKEHPRSQD